MRDSSSIAHLGLFCLLVLCGVFAGCDGVSGDDESLSESDRDLMKQLTGAWMRGNDRIDFFADGTYVDTAFISSIPYEPEDDRQERCRHNDDDPNDGKILVRIESGDYKIEDGFLRVRGLEFARNCLPRSGAHLYPPLHLQFSGDTMTLDVVSIYKSVEGSAFNIWGTWVSKYWAYAYHEGSAQIIRETIRFHPDSSNYSLTLEGLPYDGVTFHLAFEYAHPILKTPGDSRTYTVEFGDQKMYWWHQHKRVYDRIRE